MNVESNSPLDGVSQIQPNSGTLSIETETSFLSFLKEEKGNKNNSKFIKVGNETYRANTTTVQPRYQETQNSTQDIPDRTDTESDSNETPDNETPVFQHGILVQLSPLNLEPFHSQLSQTLRSFIQETVQVIKQVNSTGSDLYIFNFAKINLNVAIQRADDTLIIYIQAGETTLAEEFYKSENIDQLQRLLKERFLDLEIELRIVDESHFSSLFQQDSNPQDEQSKQSDSTEEEEERDNKNEVD